MRCLVLGSARYPRRGAGMTELVLRGRGGGEALPEPGAYEVENFGLREVVYEDYPRPADQ